MKLPISETSYLLIDEDFMDNAIVKDVVDEESAKGLGAMTALLLQLIMFDDGMASMGDIRPLAALLQTSCGYLFHIIKDYRVFRLTPDRLSFYSPYLRKTEDAEGGIAWLLDTPATEE